GGSRGGKPNDPLKTAVIQQLCRSKQIEIRSVAVSETASHFVRASSGPLAYYGALSRLSIPPAKKDPLPFVATHRLIVTGSNGKSADLDYDSHSGIIADKDGHTAQADLRLQSLLRGTAR